MPVTVSQTESSLNEHMSTRATVRREDETARVWDEIMALPEDKWRGMILKQRLRERQLHVEMEERRSRRDLPRLLMVEKKLKTLQALASSQAARIDSQAAQIADLQAMLGNALAALSPMATPQGPLPPIQSPESVELWEMLGHFGL